MNTARQGIAVLVATALAFLPQAAVAQSRELNQAYNQYRALNAEGRYAEAERPARRGLELAEREFGPDHPTVARLLDAVAGLELISGRLSEAAGLFERALAIRERAHGADHPAVATALQALARAAQAKGDHGRAEGLYGRALAIRERALGRDHPHVASALRAVADHQIAQGRYGTAESLLKRALAILGKPADREGMEAAGALGALGGLYRRLGRYQEAEPPLSRALSITEGSLGGAHPAVAAAADRLARLRQDRGRYADAERLHQRSLAIKEAALGPEHPDLVTTLNDLAGLYQFQGRFADAERSFKRSARIAEKAFGPENPRVAIVLGNLAGLHQVQGRFPEAERLYGRSITVTEAALGADHPSLAAALSNHAGFYRVVGRFADAEALYRRAVAIKERALGGDHPSMAVTLTGLAQVFWDEGRYARAEPLLKRAIAVAEKNHGRDHPPLAVMLTSLAVLYHDQGRETEAEPLLKRSLAITEKALGRDHPSNGAPLTILAGVYASQDRSAEAEPLFRRGVAIREAAFGADNVRLGPTLIKLGAMYRATGRHDDAGRVLERALAVLERAYGPDHPDIAEALWNLALLDRARGRDESALARLRRVTAIQRDRVERATARSKKGAQAEQLKVRQRFLDHVGVLAALAAGRAGAPARALGAEAFQVVQVAQASGTAQAVARMAARFAASDDALAAKVRDRQDLLDRRQALDEALVGAVGRPAAQRNADAEAALRRELAAVDRRLDDLDDAIAREFPDYAELTGPQPLGLDEARALLAPDEALVVYATGERASYLWALRKNAARFGRVDIGRSDLADAVALLRFGLDPSGVRSLADVPSFDTTQAHELYKRLFLPAEEVLAGARHVFVVPDAALQSLPLGVLVTGETRDGFTDFAGYRQVPWLARKYALTTLPSVSSLRALRRFAKATRAKRPFIGIGDPALDGEPGSERRLSARALYTDRGLTDLRAIRALPALPETADELARLAGSLGAGPESLFLRDRAREPTIRAVDLSDYRVLAFATHAAIGGELSGLTEPALVMTPPAALTDADDGLLKASEVAQIKLDADWVILSACNTAAAGDEPGAEALSGLAKAFFYAGSRALLVSHWPVFSEAALTLTTGMLATMAEDPTIRRAEALRRSMLALMETEDRPAFAHPMFWAPFVIVGEGGAVQAN